MNKRLLMLSVVSALFLVATSAFAQFAGTYHIGAAGTKPGGGDPEFASLQAACDTLTKVGLSGDATFLITSDLTEAVNVALAPETNGFTLTFKPAPSVTPTITFTQTTDNTGASGNWIFGPPDILTTSASNYGLKVIRNFVIDGSNTVGGTTRDLTIQNVAAAHVNSAPLRFLGDVNNVTIKNVIVKQLSTSTSTSNCYGIVFVDRYDGANYWTPDSITVMNCDITANGTKATNALGFTNSGTIAAGGQFTSTVAILDNKLTGGNRGIALFYAGGDVMISGNEISVAQVNGGYLSYGILPLSLQSAATVTFANNKITQLATINSTAGSYGIIGISASSGASWKIYNNMISGFATTTAVVDPSIARVWGIQVAGPTADVSHNTIYMPELAYTTSLNNTTQNYTGIYLNSGTVNALNNIIVSPGTADTSFGIYNAGATLTSNYNNVNGTKYFGYSGGLQSTLNDWTTATSQDANTTTRPVTVVSPTDLHLTGSSNGDSYLIGTPLAEVPKDIDDENRSLSYPYKGADEASIPLLPKLAGDYYIPKGANPQGFDSLATAIDSLNEVGVMGTVRFLIDTSLAEEGHRLIITRNDMSAMDNLVIKPAAGKTPKIAITSSPTTGNESRQCFTLKNGSWVTIDGSNTDGGTTRDMTISGNDPLAVYVIGIIENSDNVTLKNLVVTYDTMNTGSSSGTMIGVDGYTSFGVPENLLIENCLVGSPEKNLRNAVALWGNDASIPTQAEVRNNVLYANRRVITTYFIRGNRYVDNELYLLNPQQNTSMYAGIYLTGSVAGDTTFISRNRILSLAAMHTGATFTGGIVVYGNTGVIIAENNFITPATVTTAGAGPHSVYGVVFGSAGWNGEINLVHNTIVIPNSAAAGRNAGIGWQLNSTATMNLYNNIISVEKDAADAYPIHWPHSLGTLNSDFNNLLTSATGSIGFINGATRKALLDWQLRSGFDLNSKSKPVTFVGSGDFHLAGTSIQDTALAGMPIPQVLADFDGDPRSPTAPYMGADEPVGAPIPPARLTGVTIAESRKDENADLIPDYKISGDVLFIKGVITSPNYLATSNGTSYYIQDGTAAINLYKPGIVLPFDAGDLVVAHGKVAQYRGLTEFELLTSDSTSFQVLKKNQPLPAAKVISMAEFKANFENYEGQVVRIDTLYKSGLSPAWPGQDFDSNMLMVNAAKNDTLMVRVDKDTDIDGKVEPGYPISVTGIASQYTSGSTVYVGGLQLQPRFYTDIMMVPMPEARLATTTSLTAGITNTGHIGSLTDFANAGGFVYGGSNRLFEGALIIATDKDHVVSSARASDGAFNLGFKPVENITVTKAGQQMKFRAAFSDVDMLNKIGIKVVQTTVADSTAGKDKYMIFKYNVINMNAGAVSGLRFGSMLDWDVAATANDRGVILVESNTISGINGGNPFKVYMAYVSTTNAFMGVVPLTQSLFTAARIGINSQEVYKSGLPFSDSLKLEYISNWRATNGFTDRGTAEDLSIFFGLEPANIPGGDTVEVAYALVAGATAAEFTANAKAAQADWIAQGGMMQILTDVEDQKDALPVAFALEQNYPNPFNPVTTIKFALPASKRVSLKVYDLLGREVRVLIDKDMNAGYHQVLWDSRNGNGVPVASGMYIYQLSAGDFKATKKMMLLK